MDDDSPKPTHCMVETDDAVLSVERVVNGGMGLARVDGLVVFVPGALPGERVRARLCPVRQGAVVAELVEILERSPDRVELPLPFTADLRLTYPAQLRVKHEIVCETLGRVGHMSASIAPTVPSPVELRYRHTAQYGVTSAGRLGYRRPGTPVVDEIDDDLLVSPVIESVRRSVGMLDLSGVEDVCVRSSTRNAAALVAIVAADRDTARRVAQALPPDLVAGVSWAEPTPRGRFRGRVVHVSGTDSLEEDFGGVTLPVSATRFSQVNPPAAARLYSDVAALAGEGDLAVELYGGSGAISRHLAPRFRDVLVVETDRTAVRDGRRAAREAGVDNLRFQEADAARVRGVDRADVVIVDPPRAGMSSRALAKVLAWRARRLVYVSCDPATWARDAARTVAAGYDLVSVQPHDFFPYTHHVEILSYFELRG